MGGTGLFQILLISYNEIMPRSDQEVLVDSLIARGALKTPAIIKAFQKIDRADFVPEELKSQAYVNAPLAVGQGQTISQPLTVAFMLELLQPKAGQTILDVGAGSGWQTALLAEIVGESGHVVALEVVPELCEQGTRDIEKYHFIERKRVELHCQNATDGFLDKAPFDRIIAAASAFEIPAAWKEQLKTGGRIVAPVGMSLVLLVKKEDGSWREQEFPGFVFVPFVP